MSKRTSTTKLDHENWDAEDPPEEAGTFTSANTEVLKKRVILKAQRRSRTTNSRESEAPPSVPNIFRDIKLTTGTSSAALSFNFLNKNASENTKTESSLPKLQSSFAFVSTASTSEVSSKTGEAQFSFSSTKSTPVSESASVTTAPKSDGGSTFVTPKSPSSSTSVEATTTTQAPGSMFNTKLVFTSSGVAPATNSSKSATPLPQLSFGNVFGNSVSKSSIADIKTDTGQFNFASSSKNNETSPEHLKKLLSRENANKSSDSPPSNSFIDKDKYYLMLKGLNNSVASWIKDNVDKNPHCILTPIFSDYINYLNDIKTKYGKVRVSTVNDKSGNMMSSVPVSSYEQNKDKAISSGTAVVNEKNKECANFLLPLPQNNVLPLSASTNKSPASTPSIFSAFVSQKTFSKPETNFQSSPPTVEKSADAASGTGKQETATQSNAEKADDDDDEPPEPTPAPVVEEGAVYSKRCKVFIKKSGSYQDRGVGTAFIKPVVDNTKTQLIVRADTVLGNVLLNTLISSPVPIQRVGPNNVMVVCVPTPDEKPPPVTVLLRVKTTVDADELYEKLMCYKK